MENNLKKNGKNGIGLKKCGKMEDDLKKKKGGRRPQKKMKTVSTTKNGRQPQKNIEDHLKKIINQSTQINWCFTNVNLPSSLLHWLFNQTNQPTKIHDALSALACF
jgi:hypothetical protein